MGTPPSPILLSSQDTSSDETEKLFCYNQFPGNYSSPPFQAMKDDLRRISELGFTQVWINPIFAVCQDNPVDQAKTGSPYAMRSYKEFNRNYGEITEKQIQDYTQECKTLGLTPIFDLVGRHVAIDSPLIKNDNKFKRQHGIPEHIDTSTWFKRHQNGNFVMYRMDENYKPTGPNPWSDVVSFNYDDPKILNEVFEHFWKPFIDYNVAVLGFGGVRIDAPGYMPKAFHDKVWGYFKQKVQEVHGTPPILVAETVGRDTESANDLKGHVTHVMNSVFYMSGGYETLYGHGQDEWRSDANWCAQNRGELSAVARTVGFPGSHDEKRFIAQLREKHEIEDPIVLRQRMLEKIMVAGFFSDAGYIFQYGDEFGEYAAVNLFSPIPITPEGKIFDLTPDIKQINLMLQKTPEPKFPQWSQRVFHDQYPELVIMIVHQGEGFSGNNYLLIGDSYGQKEIHLSEKDMEEILKANGRNTTAEQKKISAVYCCSSNVSIQASKEYDIFLSEKSQAVNHSQVRK